MCELFQKTFSRALLLVICLGYGIARPRLHKAEWMSLLTLSVLYLGSTIMDEVQDTQKHLLLFCQQADTIAWHSSSPVQNASL